MHGVQPITEVICHFKVHSLTINQCDSTTYKGIGQVLNGILYIKKYTSRLYLSRDWVGSKWRPVVKVLEQFQDEHSKLKTLSL